jgi:hypothetical protein
MNTVKKVFKVIDFTMDIVLIILAVNAIVLLGIGFVKYYSLINLLIVDISIFSIGTAIGDIKKKLNW